MLCVVDHCRSVRGVVHEQVHAVARRVDALQALCHQPAGALLQGLAGAVDAIGDVDIAGRQRLRTILRVGAGRQENQGGRRHQQGLHRRGGLGASMRTKSGGAANSEAGCAL